MTDHQGYHLLVKELSDDWDPEFVGPPECWDIWSYRIECPEDPSLGRSGYCGLISCTGDHQILWIDPDGDPQVESVADPYDCPPGAPWEGAEEWQFHGVFHTYMWELGWSVPHRGCVWDTNADDFSCAEQLPPGVYPVDGDWNETEVYLYLAPGAGPNREKN